MMFESQTPINRDMHSFFYLGGMEGVVVDAGWRFQYEKHPFEEGGTFAFWFFAEKAQQEAKLLSLLGKDHNGF